MEESAPRATLDEGLDRLVDLPIQTDHVAARAQRNPVEVDCSGRGGGCRSCSLQRPKRGFQARPVPPWKGAAFARSLSPNPHVFVVRSFALALERLKGRGSFGLGVFALLARQAPNPRALALITIIMLMLFRALTEEERMNYIGVRPPGAHLRGTR